MTFIPAVLEPGGVLVTDRMLGMFRGRDRKPKQDAEEETVSPSEAGQ